jgi:hypothetical protein
MRESLALFFAAAVLLSAPAPADANKGLIGTWRAHAMKMKGKVQPMPKGMKVTIEFKKDHTFIGRMEAHIPKKPPHKSTEKGTWKIKGKVLITKTKKTERMTFNVKGKTLTLTKTNRGETLILKRVD